MLQAAIRTKIKMTIAAGTRFGRAYTHTHKLREAVEWWATN